MCFCAWNSTVFDFGVGLWGCIFFKLRLISSSEAWWQWSSSQSLPLNAALMLFCAKHHVETSDKAQDKAHRSGCTGPSPWLSEEDPLPLPLPGKTLLPTAPRFQAHHLSPGTACGSVLSAQRHLDTQGTTEQVLPLQLRV